MIRYILIIILMVNFLACKPIKEIEYRDSIKVEYRDRLRVDSVLSHIKDSIYINGDTTKIYRDRWLNRIVLKSDTVTKEIKVVEIKKETVVEKIGIWSWIKIFIYGAIFGAGIFILVKYWIRIISLFKYLR